MPDQENSGPGDWPVDMDRSGTRPHTAATAATLANSCPSRKTMTTSKLPPVTLVLGGARPGPSTYTEPLALSQAGPSLHLATTAPAEARWASRAATRAGTEGIRRGIF